MVFTPPFSAIEDQLYFSNTALFSDLRYLIGKSILICSQLNSYSLLSNLVPWSLIHLGKCQLHPSIVQITKKNWSYPWPFSFPHIPHMNCQQIRCLYLQNTLRMWFLTIFTVTTLIQGTIVSWLNSWKRLIISLLASTLVPLQLSPHRNQNCPAKPKINNVISLVKNFYLI